MYIGSTGQRGLHHLIYEILDNAVDEMQAGAARQAWVELDLPSGWVRVRDDGRGIPTARHPVTGVSALETVLTVLHAGGKFGGQASGYGVSGGLHGVGLSVVNALSAALEVEVWRDGRALSQLYRRGVPLTGLLDEAEMIQRRQESLQFNGGATDGAGRGRKGASLEDFMPAPHPFDHADAPWLGPAAAGKAARAPSSAGKAARAPSSASPSSMPGTQSMQHGTEVRFRFDPAIFSSGAEFDPETVRGRLRETAFINAGAAIHFRVGGGGKDAKSKEADEHGWETFVYKGGLGEYISYITRGKQTVHAPIVVSDTVDDVEIALALQWCERSYSDTMLSFVNSVKTVDGGTHLDGFKAGLTRTVNALARKQRLLKDSDANISGDFIREGLSAVVAVKVVNPEFEGQTKARLGSPEVRRAVEAAVAGPLATALEQNRGTLATVVTSAQSALRAAEAARRARDLVRRKTVLSSSTLPGKLADCTSSSRSDAEIFIVEGDSAGGSAKQARDRVTQAVLPLRGKILNTERCDDASMYQSAELADLIVALGLRVRGDGAADRQGPAKKGRKRAEATAADAQAVDRATSPLPSPALRYGRVIILTDADVDGAHIRTLLLAFLFRCQRELFERGQVFVGMPPLYRVHASRARGGDVYCYTDEELAAALEQRGKDSHVQRFKGLGEMMPQQLWDTTLDPARRSLRRLTLEDAAAAERMFDALMGSRPAARRELIAEFARGRGFRALDG